MIPDPVAPLTWHDGPCFEDANGVWWDVEFGDLETWFVHRESGDRLLVVQSIGVEWKHAAQQLAGAVRNAPGVPVKGGTAVILTDEVRDALNMIDRMT